MREKIGRYRPEQLIYIDESGIDSHETYPYGWSLKGERFYSSRPGKKRSRLSIIGALCQKKFLLPQLLPGQVIMMDNAPFHSSGKIGEIIEEAGCKLLFLPSYSPDLNPMEHWWHKVKTAIRKQLPLHNFDVHKAGDAPLQYW